MKKDLKTGMLIGLAVVMIAAVWFSSRTLKSTSPSQENNTQSQKNTVRYEKQLPNSPAEQTRDKNQPGNEEIIIHTVEKEQTLSGISELYYGSSKYVSLIIENNKIENPDEIKPGMKLEIPPRP